MEACPKSRKTLTSIPQHCPANTNISCKYIFLNHSPNHRRSPVIPRRDTDSGSAAGCVNHLPIPNIHRHMIHSSRSIGIKHQIPRLHFRRIHRCPCVGLGLRGSRQSPIQSAPIHPTAAPHDTAPPWKSGSRCWNP